MKVQHAYCGAQHRSAMLPVLDELTARGHEVVEVSLVHGAVNERKPGYEQVDVEGSKAFLCSYPHIMRMAVNEKAEGYKKAYGLKVSVEHGVNPISWAFPLERHACYDVVCCSGKWQMDAVKRSRHAKILAGKCVLTGWPKADALARVTPADRRAAREALAAALHLDLGKPVIGFVPTHGAASRRAGELVRLKIPNLVIAPHEGDYAKFQSGEFGFDPKKYPHYLETDAIYEVLLACDLVISDYSSAILEAAILDIPLIQLLEGIKLHMRPNWDVLAKGYYQLSQGDTREFKLGPNVRPTEIRGDLLRHIEEGLTKDPFATKRHFWVGEIFHDLGNATKNVCDLIEKRAK